MAAADEGQGAGGGGGERPRELPERKQQWSWDEERSDSAPGEGESRPFLDERESEIVAEAELLLASGMTVEEVADLVKRSRIVGRCHHRSEEAGCTDAGDTTKTAWQEERDAGQEGGGE